jgi:glycine cleavage system H lipoate-binding protein
MIPRSNLAKEDPCVGCPERCPVYQKFIGDQKTESKEEAFMGKTEVKECIWMKAGVVSYRLCTRNYDCKSCEFDQALMSQTAYGEQPVIAQAIEKLRSLPGDKRMCRYYLTGDLSYKICSNNYECWHCPVDQMISDLTDSHPLILRRRAREIKPKKICGFVLNPDVYYHPNHLWVKVEKEGTVRLGIDDFAAKLFGEITEVSLPREGEMIKSGETDLLFRIGKKEVKIPLPISGEVKRINREVVDQPKFITQEPYEKGWLFSVLSEDIADFLINCLRGNSAEKWIQDEFEELQQILKKECEITISDGGELVSNFTTKLTPETWERLIEKFLKSKQWRKDD